MPVKGRIPAALIAATVLLSPACRTYKPINRVNTGSATEIRPTSQLGFDYGKFSRDKGNIYYNQTEIQRMLALDPARLEESFYDRLENRLQQITRNYEAAAQSPDFKNIFVDFDRNEGEKNCNSNHIPKQERLRVPCFYRMVDDDPAQLTEVKRKVSYIDGAWDLNEDYSYDDFIASPYFRDLPLHAGNGKVIFIGGQDKIFLQRYKDGMRLFKASIEDSDRDGNVDRVVFSPPYYFSGMSIANGEEFILTAYGLFQKGDLEIVKLRKLSEGLRQLGAEYAYKPGDIPPENLAQVNRFFLTVKTRLQKLDAELSSLPNSPKN